MLAIIYSDSYYIRLIPLFLLQLQYQCIQIFNVKTFKKFTCILMLCEPTPEVETLLSSFTGCKIAIGIKIKSPNLYNYIFTHNYYDQSYHYIPNLELLISKSPDSDLNRIVIFENEHPPEELNILKSYLQKRYNVTIYSKLLSYSFEDIISITRKARCAICLTYQSLIACIVTQTPIYPIACTEKTISFLEQVGLKSYNYVSSIIEWYHKLNNNRNEILIRMDQFHKQSLFLLHKHPIIKLIGLHIYDTRHIVFNLLHHTDDFLNGARLLCSLILNDPNSSQVPIIHDYLCNSDESLINRINSSTNRLLRHASVSTYMVKNISPSCEYIKRQAPHLFTDNLKFDDDIHRTFINWGSYMIYKGTIPYTEWWCGLLYLSCEPLFQNIQFIQSLHRCRFIGVATKKYAKQLRTYLKIYSPHTKIYIFHMKINNDD